MVSAAAKIRVAVLMGGPSDEREVSLRSGAAVLRALDRRRYAPVAVDIRRDGTWGLPAPTLLEGPAGAALPAPEFGGLVAERVRTVLARAAREGSLDAVFVALHGRFGEDGTIQGMLEAAGIPYTGSGVLASALAMDKERAKAVVASAGVGVARGRCVSRAEWEAGGEEVLAALLRSPGLPAFVKPAAGGSSLGAGPADGAAELRARVEEVFARQGDAALVEERLAGTEVTCAVLGNRGSELAALPPVEIVPRGRPFFDFVAKYDAAACEEICPARVDAETRERVEEAARAAHRALGCDGMSRSDFILRGGEPVYLETNTIPGMTETSLCPRAARAAGLSFPALLDRLLAMARERAPGAASAPAGERAA